MGVKERVVSCREIYVFYIYYLDIKLLLVSFCFIEGSMILRIQKQFG